MIQLSRSVSLVALLLLAAHHLDAHLFSADSSPTRILDDGTLDIEAIARVMCEPSVSRHGQISRLSTVDKLVEFFEVSGEGREFVKCRQQHGAALRQLQVALNASKENVCSAEKLALIEEFHNKFVSTRSRHERARQEAQRHAAPELLRLFFMHYAMQVEATCKRGFIENLERDLQLKLGNDINERLFEMKEASGNPEERAALRAEFDSAMQKFTALNPVKKCEDVLIVWNQIENSFVGEKLNRKELTVEDELDAQTGEPIRMLVKLRSSRSLNAIKEHCHYNLKPIYSKLVLPIIKLADLGYSNNGAQFKSELEQTERGEEPKRWIRVTQLCETILPVKYYEDSSLGLKDMEIITKGEAAELDEAAAKQAGVAEPRTKLVFEPETNSLVGFDRCASVAALDAKKLAKSVESNSKARRHVIRRAVIRLVRNLKSIYKLSREGHISFPKSAGPSALARSKSNNIVDLFADEKIEETLEGMSAEDILKPEGGAPPSRSETGGLLKAGNTKRLADRWAGHKRRFKLSLLFFAILLFVVGCYALPITVTVLMVG